MEVPTNALSQAPPWTDAEEEGFRIWMQHKFGGQHVAEPELEQYRRMYRDQSGVPGYNALRGPGDY